VGLGFELRVLCLHSKYSTTWAPPPVCFSFWLVLESNLIFHVSLFFFLEVLGFELRALHLLSRHSIASMPPAFFAFGYFFNRVSCFCLGQPEPWPFSLCLPGRWDDRDMPLNLAYWLRWESRSLFCLSQPWTPNFLISTSQIAEIIGVSGHATFVLAIEKLGLVFSHINISLGALLSCFPFF
jgi:hypothetical protein